MRGKYKVHLKGNEYTVKGFPWMMQDTDVTICAHFNVDGTKNIMEINL